MSTVGHGTPQPLSPFVQQTLYQQRTPGAPNDATQQEIQRRYALQMQMLQQTQQQRMGYTPFQQTSQVPTPAPNVPQYQQTQQPGQVNPTTVPTYPPTQSTQQHHPQVSPIQPMQHQPTFQSTGQTQQSYYSAPGGYPSTAGGGSMAPLGQGMGGMTGMPGPYGMQQQQVQYALQQQMLQRQAMMARMYGNTAAGYRPMGYGQTPVGVSSFKLQNIPVRRARSPSPEDLPTPPDEYELSESEGESDGEEDEEGGASFMDGDDDWRPGMKKTKKVNDVW